jgi:hypothetical protein
MDLDITVDDTFSEERKKLIYKTITIFQNFEVVNGSSEFKIDGNVFCRETSGYYFYVATHKKGFHIQVFKNGKGTYEFGLIMEKENDKLVALAYHNAFE